MFYGYDPTYILVIIGAILSMIASSFVQSTYSKYSRVQSRTGMTGAQAAQRILQMSGISDVRIEHVSGKLTDHYDPSQKGGPLIGQCIWKHFCCCNRRGSA